MAVELGVGYLSIVPETSKIAPGVRKALGESEKAADGSGKTIGSRLSGSASKALKVGFASAGVAAGAVFGTAIAKGFGRLSAIDEAQAKLKGLGNSTQQIGTIMDNALASVKGTAYGLGEAVTTSAGLVAAGVAEGPKLEQTLKTVADTAAIAGASMADVGLIFGSVAARGKLQGDDLMQLQSRGVPVLKMLAEETGKTSEEISAMVSKGQIDFETFASAMEKGVGGAAVAMGDTFKGGLANLGASLGRFGAALLDPVFQAAPPIFGALTDLSDKATDAVKPLAAEFGARLTPAIKEFAEGLPGLISAAGEKIGPVISAIGDTVGKLWTYLTTDPGVAERWDSLKALFAQVGETAAALWPSFVEVGKAVGTALGAVQVETWKLLGQALEVATPIIKQLLDTMAEHPDAVAAFVTAWAGMKVVGTVTGPVGKGVGALRELGGAAKFAKDALKGSDSVGSAMINLAGGASSTNPKIAKLGGAFTVLGGKMFKIGNIMKVLRRAGAPIIRVLGTAIRFINPWVAGFTLLAGALSLFFTKTETGRQIWSGFMDLLHSAGEWISNTFAGVWDVVAEKFSAAWDRVSEIFGGLKALIVDGDFTGELGRALGIEEDSPLVAGILGFRDKIIGAVDAIKTKWDEFTGLFSGLKALIVDGDFTGELGRALGIEEDSPLVAGILGFRDKIIEAYGAIKEKFDTVVQAFSDKWNEASTTVTPLLDTLREKWDSFASGLGEKYREHIAPHVDALKTKIGEMSDKFREFLERLWEPVLKPALATLAALLVGPIVLAFGAVVLAVGTVVAVIGTLAYAVLAMPGWISTAIQKVNEWWNTLQQRVSTVIDAVKIAIQVWYEQHIAPLPGKVGAAITGVIDWFKKLPGQIQSQFANAGRWLVDAGKRIMNGLLDGLRSKLGEVRGWISDHLSFNLGGLIGNAQGAVYRAYVDGGIDRLERYANGGHREDHRAQIAPAGAWRVWAEPETGGEAYIPLAASKRSRSTAILDQTARIFGLALVDPITGTAPGIGYRGNLGPAKAQAFADGGLVPSAEIKRRLKPLDGTPYIFGGWSMAGTDCSGAVAMVDNAFRSLALLTERMSTQTEAAFLSKRGYRRGQGSNGDLRVGFLNGGPGGGHTAAQLPDGTYVESGGNTGGGLTIGRKAGPLSGRGFTDFFYHRGVDGIVSALTGKEDTAGGPSGPAEAPSAVGRAINPNFGTADSLYQDALKYLTRTKVYDTGGILPHGASAVNLSGKPELILNNSQWSSFAKMADALPKLVDVLRRQVQGPRASGEEITRAGFADAADGISRVHREVYAFGRHLGGEFLGQVQIVADAEKGLYDTRRAVLQETEQLTRYREDLAAAEAELAKVQEEGGGLSVAMTRRLADAEEELTKARASTGDGKPERIAAAEKKLQRAREDADAQLEKSADKNASQVRSALRKVQTATDKLAEAEEKSADAADRLAAAERAVAAARYQAIGQLASRTLNAFKSAASGAEAFFGEIARLGEIAARTQQEVSKLEQQQVELRLDGIQAAQNLAQAEWGVRSARLEGLLAVARAEANLVEAREGALRLGSTSVEAVRARIEEFHRTGVWAIEGVRDAATINARKIKIAEAEVAKARAEATKTDLLAQQRAAIASLQMMKATLMQQRAAELLELQTMKLRDQTAELYGMSSGTASKAQRQAHGLGNVLGGIGKIALGIAGAVAGFAVGGPVGAAVGAGLALKGVGEVVAGGMEMHANKGGLKEAWDEANTEGKVGMALGIGAQALGAIGGAALAVGGNNPEAFAIGAEAGAEASNAIWGAMAANSKARSEAATAEIDAKIAETEARFALDLAKLNAATTATELGFADKTAAADLGIKIAELQIAMAKASSKEEAKLLTEYSRTAEEHREKLLASAAERARTLTEIRDANQAAGDPRVAGRSAPERVTLQVQAGAVYDNADLEKVVAELAEELGEVKVDVEIIKDSTKPTADDYVSSRR
ncbi:tape measure protein [Corynebacterium antarcticum]|uniref:tape measure protein n=1 Tax=Corynebacterium antarcticum TaxID=2800405 RepID=UPI0020045736|nr:tape measure protein [Corynebacterium antarcticum]MCK7661966.1 tape measure protein [Corynebacterium antarcticum]